MVSTVPFSSGAMTAFIVSSHTSGSCPRSFLTFLPAFFESGGRPRFFALGVGDAGVGGKACFRLNTGDFEPCSCVSRFSSLREGGRDDLLRVTGPVRGGVKYGDRAPESGVRKPGASIASCSNWPSRDSALSMVG